MARRSRIEHEADIKEIFSFALTQPGADSVLMDLYTLSLSLSNALAGYVYRTIEEMTCERSTPPLSRQEKSYLLRTMYEESGAHLTSSEYRVLRDDDPIDSRLLFCLAIRCPMQHIHRHGD
jgi:hypothetical protein